MMCVVPSRHVVFKGEACTELVYTHSRADN